MKLLLTSNGITNTSIENVFLRLLKKTARKNKVIFVTTAAYGENDNPTWLEHYRTTLRKYGINKIEDLDMKNKTEKELRKILSPSDIIFINGGNTFYLLKHIQESGFDKIISDFLNNGKIYIGVSAGSIIACPTIETALWKPADENKVNLKDFTGLGLVNFLISPHFKEKEKESIEKEMIHTKYPTVILNDQQAVLCIDGKYKIIGDGEKLTFNGFQEAL